jgi:hypothetical protein
MHLRKFSCFHVPVTEKLTTSKSRLRIYHADWSYKYWMEDVHDKRIMGYYHLGFDRTLYFYSVPWSLFSH